MSRIDTPEYSKNLCIFLDKILFLKSKKLTNFIYILNVKDAKVLQY
jgi:hypothetical protein